MPKSENDKIGRAGEHYVAAELNRRGAYAAPFSGNVPGIDVVATDDDLKHTAYIQVKTSRGDGRWHMSQRHGWDNITLAGCPKNGKCPKTCTPSMKEPIAGKPDHFWVFVSLTHDGAQQYYVVEDGRVRKMMRKGYEAYLKQHGGQKPGKNHDSLHALLTNKDLQDWKDNWEILGLWPLSE